MIDLLDRLRIGLRRYYYGDQTGNNLDEIQLRALASSFYAAGLIGVLFSCFSLPNLLAALVFGLIPAYQNGAGDFDHHFILALSIGTFVFLIGILLLERLAFFTCQCVSQRRRYGFVLAMTWLSVIILPAGPFLCAYGLKVLRRESVRSLFA